MNNIETVPGIYLGDRQNDFKTMITAVLKKGIQGKNKYPEIMDDDDLIELLTDATSMKEYNAVFTSELIDPTHNYQVYEQLGDLSGNKFIVRYIYRRFPQLMCTDGVKVAARLRINYGAKQSFYKIAESLNFWPFITATNDLRLRKMKNLLEDVFEAFLGATECLLDDRVNFGFGWTIIYDILEAIFDELHISLQYEDLYDAKTRLKELGDLHGIALGPIVYKDEKKDQITYSAVYRVVGGSYELRPDGTPNMKRIIGGKYVKVGEGSAALKSDAQQKASAEALETLAKEGFVKHPPRIYQQFAQGERKEIKEIKTIDTDDINEMITGKRTKYQSKYECTRLARYCRERNYSGVKACIKQGADPNKPDTDNMSPLDLLFIGRVDEHIVKKIMKKLIKGGCNMEMAEPVYRVYYGKYKRSFFIQQIPNITVLEDTPVTK